METQTKMRIHVGGLGETVTQEDIQNTFSKSGRVEAVEFVRTKGRSFAYIDFLPTSDKSVAKLFSTYNGCAWKGGKLRLEKAKLHYLERLKCEWAEDADLGSKKHGDDDAKNMVSLEGHEEALDESSQIYMFFPRLRKLKALPYKGTGKHKYSFQRIEASDHPVHFCDCVEHARNINTNKETQVRQISMKDVGMNQDEINMMNSVLSKFLKGKDTPSNHLPDDQNHNGDSTDDDNIIINAGAGPHDVTHLLESMRKQTGSHSKMARPKKLQSSGDGQSQNIVRVKKGKGRSSWRNGKLVQVVGCAKKVEFSTPNRKQTRINQSERQAESLSMNEKRSIGNTSLSPPMKTGVSKIKAPESGAANLPSGDSMAVSLSNVVKHEAYPESHPPKQLNESTNTDPNNAASDKPARGTSRSRNSSWMQLVSSANSSPFSISQILPKSEVSKKSTQSSSSRRTGINESGNSAPKRKRENTGEGL